MSVWLRKRMRPCICTVAHLLGRNANLKNAEGVTGSVLTSAPRIGILCGLDAEFGADGISYSVGVQAHEGLGLGFDHDAAESLGAE